MRSAPFHKKIGNQAVAADLFFYPGDFAKNSFKIRLIG